MDPRRAWDPRMDPRAGRGDGRQQLFMQQQQQQAFEVPWQDQVRGNPQAEYAALAQARGSAEAGVGGAMPQWQAPGGGQATHGTEGNGLYAGGGGGMGGYVPRGDPADEYAAMAHARSMGLPEGVRREFHVPALGMAVPGTGGVGTREFQMPMAVPQTAAMAAAPAALTAAAATPAMAAARAAFPPPRQYAPPGGQQLVFTPGNVVGMEAGQAAGSTRSRIDSPPRPAAAATARAAARVWETRWLRELDVSEALASADLDGCDLTELLELSDEEAFPPAAFVERAAKLCRANTAARRAAVARWNDGAFDALVMVKAVVSLMLPDRVTVDMGHMELMRDAVVKVFPWAFNVSLGDDYEWPELGQTQDAASASCVVHRLVWLETILRLAVGAHHGRAMNVRWLLPRPADDGAEAGAAPARVADPALDVRRDYGADVAAAGQAARTAANTCANAPEIADCRRRKVFGPMLEKMLRRLRNDVAEDEHHRLPERVTVRATAVSEARRARVMEVDARGCTTVTLAHDYRLAAARGMRRHPAELVMCEAGVGEEIVRQISDAIELVAGQPHVDAVKDFAVKIMRDVKGGEDGEAGSADDRR